ncbi:hypothetical protein [Acidocella facilis]|uniref:hypothetical protein n=1 Tax=Acidocella facilis TaxID=525 RepID=UPI001F1965C0|nr:hypothetical protein [Acidocella facilis]
MMQPVNGEHASRSGFNSGIVDLAILNIEMMAVALGIEPAVIAGFILDKAVEIDKSEAASLVKAARMLPLQIAVKHFEATSLEGLRSKYGNAG